MQATVGVARPLSKKIGHLGTNTRGVRDNGQLQAVQSRASAAIDAQLRVLARRLVADRALAEDAVQDTWVSVLSGGRAQTRPASWWRGALRNRARMRVRADDRRRRREVAGSGLEPVEDPSEGLERRELLDRLRRAITELPEPARTIVRQRWLEERTSAAIACELGLEPATVRWHLARGMTRLRAQLVDEPQPTQAWLTVPWLRPSPALPVGLALTTAVVFGAGSVRCAAETPSSNVAFAEPPNPSRAMPRIPETPSRLVPTLLCAVGLAGCVDAPEASSTPEPIAASLDRLVTPDEPDEAPVEACADLCMLSLSPRLRVDCSGVGHFDSCADQCAESFCPSGDLSFTAEDVTTIGTAGCGDLWCPTGCEDAAAWGQCTSDCADTAAREHGDKTCSFAGVQHQLCDLECRAKAAAEAAG